MTFRLLSCIISVFYKVRGLSFNTEPNRTIVAFTGSNQTFKWSLNLTAEEKTKEMWAYFGTWDESYQEISQYFLKIVHESSGKETMYNFSAVARRLVWTGDLSRNYYVSFLLVNVQPTDSGNYGLEFRVDGYPPVTKEGWFSLSVQVTNIFLFSQSELQLFCKKIFRESSGQENIIRTNPLAAARRLFWTGDLSRNYYASFLLINVQRTDMKHFYFIAYKYIKTGKG